MALFLITPNNIGPPIIGYNVIELLVKETMEMGNADNLLECMIGINENDPDNFCLVKTQQRNIVIPRSKTVDVPCRANTGSANHKTPVLFQPSECSHLPSGLSIQEELTTVKQGNSTLLCIKVTDNTEHDITLFCRTILGHLHLVRSITITPFDVKFKETPVNSSATEVHSKSPEQNYHEDLTTLMMQTRSATVRFFPGSAPAGWTSKDMLRIY